MSASSRSKDDVESPPESPLFTLGSVHIGHVPRQWERVASAPHRRQLRKGTKVWRRQAPQNRDALVSAQLLGDLEASVSAHTAKRQRIQPAPLPPRASKARTELSYAPTASDVSTPARRRKTAGRGKTIKSPAASHAATDRFSPTRRITRRRSLLTTSEVPDVPEAALDAESVSEQQVQPGRVQESFVLGAVNLQGSKIQDDELQPAEDSEDSEGYESASESELSTSDMNAGEGSDGESPKEEEDYSEDSDADIETGRLVNAGNTGVVSLGLAQENSDSEDCVGTQSLTEDFDDTAMQNQVVEFLRTTSGESPAESIAVKDEDTVPIPPGTGDGSLSQSLSSFQSFDSSDIPTFAREDTGSTVAFENLDVTGLVFGTEPPARLVASPGTEGGAEEVTEAASSVPQAVALNKAQTVEVEAEVEAKDEIETEAEAEGSNKSPTVQRTTSVEDTEDESADELFGGSPTQHKLVLSPIKSAPSVNLSPKKTRSGSRLSDDTVYLNDFLTRVRSQAASRSLEPVRSPVKKPVSRDHSRRILGELDTNSPPPSSLKHNSHTPEKDRTRHVDGGADSMGSPTRLPRTPMAQALLASNLESPETPDELIATSSLAEPDQAGDSLMARRSNRARLVVPSRLPMSAPSNIPFRRMDGDPPVLQRTEAQRLARTTAANTRRNKGGARVPKHVLEGLEAKQLSPVKSRGAMKNRKGRNVDWDHRLVYYLEDTGKEVEIDENGRVVEKENGQEVKRKVRIVKGEKVIPSGDLPSTSPAEDVLSRGPPSNTEIATAEPSLKDANLARTTKSAAAPTTSRKADSSAPARSSAAADSKHSKSLISAAKPRRAIKPVSGISVRGTPAAKRVLSVEPAVPSTATAAKKRTRRI